MKRGFTLIELLVVIAIIGILSSIVVASLSGAKGSGRDAKRISDIKNIQLALALYYNDNLKYPPTLTDATFSPYIGTPPKDPSTNTLYFYAALVPGSIAPGQSCSLATRYHLGAVLENTNNSEDAGLAKNSMGFSCGTTPSDFYGESPDCGDTLGSDFCYDFTNN